MAISISFILVWFFVSCFLLIPKTLSFLHNFILFMFTTIVSTNVMTILTMQLEFIKNTQNPFLFIVFILYRDVLIPVIVLLFVNVSLHSEKKRLFFLLALLILVLFDYFLVQFKVMEFIKWNFLFAMIVHSAYLLIGLLISKLLTAMDNRGESIK
ncbi:hypothetical protein [Pseudalkalibacillus caeni]|uniref:Uncharacterized protein n=1 Tax=Exobacillus caeni TaxID=2574798 RepID=A0A5R9EV40_9BACL|nr:hypothetical protein [Pseudalkalibacillus caeni]TLS34927.1 hypothetical protein FCL54_23205 [Pseudalkalibacillus caeni]